MGHKWPSSKDQRAEERTYNVALTDETTVNKADGEDCEACVIDGTQCLFHEGVEVGYGLARERMEKALDAD